MSLEFTIQKQYSILTIIIDKSIGIIVTIGKHIRSKNMLSRVYNYIRIHEPPGLRIIVPALEVVQPGLPVVAVTPVQVRVQFNEFRALLRPRFIDDRRFPPRVIHVTHKKLSRQSAVDPGDVSLQVLPVRMDHRPHLDRYRTPFSVIVVPQARVPVPSIRVSGPKRVLRPKPYFLLSPEEVIIAVTDLHLVTA